MSVEVAKDGTAKTVLPEEPVPLVDIWLAFLCAFVCFISAGYQLTSIDARLYEELNLELPAVVQFQIAHKTSLALSFVAAGLVTLALTRVRRGGYRGERLRFLAGAFAVLAAVLASGVLYSGGLVFTKLHQSLGP